MIEFGYTLRKAREAKGLTIEQIATSTHMLSKVVESLENEDFSRIVAPIYGRGFVKLYCEAVGLDPKPLQAEFMDIYTHRRPPTIRMRPAQTAQAPTQAAIPANATAPAVPSPSESVAANPVSVQKPVVEAPAEIPPPQPIREPINEEPIREQMTDVPVTSNVTSEPTPPIAAEPPVQAVETEAPPQPASPYLEFNFNGSHQEAKPVQPAVQPIPRHEPAPAPQRPTVKRPANPLSDYTPSTPIKPSSYGSSILPPAFWRILLLLALVGLLGWGAIALLGKIYRSFMKVPAETETTTEKAPVAIQPTAPSSRPKTASEARQKPTTPPSGRSKAVVPAPAPARGKRTPIDIPPLYVG